MFLFQYNENLWDAVLIGSHKKNLYIYNQLTPSKAVRSQLSVGNVIHSYRLMRHDTWHMYGSSPSSETTVFTIVKKSAAIYNDAVAFILKQKVKLLLVLSFATTTFKLNQ